MALRLGPVALRRGTHPVAELHAFHARDKRWPATLAELPAEVQACTFDPFSGKPFVYKLVDGEPLLYAVGLDQKDNGGVHDPSYGRREPNGDYVVWPLPGNM